MKTIYSSFYAFNYAQDNTKQINANRWIVKSLFGRFDHNSTLLRKFSSVETARLCGPTETCEAGNKALLRSSYRVRGVVEVLSKIMDHIIVNVIKLHKSFQTKEFGEVNWNIY